MANDRERLIHALLLCAPHHQGGHSASGDAIAEIFSIPFPLDMENLRIAALRHGYDPDELWPWWKRMRERQVKCQD